MMASTFSNSLALMGLQTAAFVMAWLTIHRRVSRRGPIPYASSISRIHNRIYSVLSLVMLFLILTPQLGAQARTLYHYSKFYEYLDLLLVRASGGFIGLHFGIHHLTTPYLTFFRVVQNSVGWTWQPFAALNAFHHALMYAYFGGWAATRPLLPVTGTIQLVVGIMAEIFAVRTKTTGPVWPHVIAGGLLSTYLVLNTRDLMMRGAASSEEEAKKAQ
jgi:hypothetical protein